MDKKVIRARDVMRTQFVEIDGLATVREGIAAFREHEVEMLVVKKRPLQTYEK
jgi:hypothetical protein